MDAPRPPRRPAVLVPALALIDWLRTSVRLALLVIVLLIPTGFATWSYLGAIGGQLAFSTRERSGAAVVAPTLTALANTVAGRPADLTPLEKAVAAHPELDTRAALIAVRQAATVTPATPATRAALAGALAALVTQVGNNSNLILDPDLDSFYVMDIQVVQMPRLLLAAALAAAPASATTTSALAGTQAVQAGGLAAGAEAVRSDVQTALAHTADHDLAARLAGSSRFADAAAALGTQLSGSLDRPAAADPGPVATAALAAAGDVVTGLDRLLAARVGHLAQNRRLTLTVTAAGLLLAVWVAAAVWWRTRIDVGLALSGITRLAEGDLSPMPLPRGSDEMGDIGRAVEVTREALVGQQSSQQSTQALRDEQMQAGFAQQQRTDKHVRARAQNVIDETASAVVHELQQVVDQVDAVRTAARTIDERVAAANEATSDVVGQARQADNVVSALEKSLARVAGTAQLIAGVAGQTRLLALNASIEAARAGDAGLGFTVVADEVKDLATTTADSTAQIAETITVLERDAAAMSHTIAAMAAGVGGVGEATEVLRNVAVEQHAVVQRLEHCVADAMDRVRQMGELTERLDRRHGERIAASGAVSLLRANGSPAVVGELLDISSGGVRCAVASDFEPVRGEPLRVDLKLDGVPLSAQARVMHWDIRGPLIEIGMLFLAPPPEVADQIDAYILELPNDT
jgi:methyl-accepting chemotaxis protein